MNNCSSVRKDQPEHNETKMEKIMITQNSWIIALWLLPVIIMIILPLAMLVIWLVIKPLKVVIVTGADTAQRAESKQHNDDTATSLATSSL